MAEGSTKKLVRLAALSAIAVILMLLVRFPLLPAAPYLEYTPSDIPLLIACFLYGPLYGLSAILVTCLIQGFSVSSASGIIGTLMNFMTTSLLCLPAAVIYRRKKTTKSMVLGLAVGSIIMVSLAMVLNILLTPLYAPGVTMSAVVGMILPVLLPFNLLRVVINSTLTFALMKAVGPILSKDIGD